MKKILNGISWAVRKNAAAKKITRWAAFAVAVVVVAVGFALYGCRASTPPEDLACRPPESKYYNFKDAIIGRCFITMRALEIPEPPVKWNTEEYRAVGEQPFVAVATNPLSTFGADVDTAGYANMRRMVMSEKRLPPPESVRLEELINYFRYDYPQPANGEVLRPHFEMKSAPWNPAHQLLLIGVQAKAAPKSELPPSHYVFLIDNSGSMENVFPLVKSAMTTLARQLRKGDKVSMITYGGGVKILLEGCGNPEKVCRKIEELEVASPPGV